MKPKSPHMSPEEFKANGYAFIDWIAKYYEEVEAYPVMSQVSPGAIAAKLPSEAPEHPESLAAVLEDMGDIIVPGLTHWASPNFFAYFPSNASPPSVLGDLLSSGLGTQGMLWATSPAATELETRVMDWLAVLLALPKQFHSNGPGGGVIQDSASSATLSAILAARGALHTGTHKCGRACHACAIGGLCLRARTFEYRKGEYESLESVPRI